MTKEEMLHNLMSLAVGQYEMHGKIVLVEPILIQGLRRGKHFIIKNGPQSVSFEILHRRDGICAENMVAKNVDDPAAFFHSIFPPEPTLEQGLKRESLEVFVLIFCLLAIVATPITMVGFIMGQAWAWGTLSFLLVMVANALWLWGKLK